MDDRRCPLCKRAGITYWRFCCPRCYRSMPDPMRHAIGTAWRNRVMNPARYAEELAAVLMWHRDHSVDHQEKRLEGHGDISGAP